MGNSIYAIETNLSILKKRLSQDEVSLKIAEEISISIEKAKAVIEEFK